MIVSMAIDIDSFEWFCKQICCLFVLPFALKVLVRFDSADSSSSLVSPLSGPGSSFRECSLYRKVLKIHQSTVVVESLR